MVCWASFPPEAFHWCCTDEDRVWQLQLPVRAKKRRASHDITWGHHMTSCDHLFLSYCASWPYRVDHHDTSGRHSHMSDFTWLLWSQLVYQLTWAYGVYKTGAILGSTDGKVQLWGDVHTQHLRCGWYGAVRSSVGPGAGWLPLPLHRGHRVSAVDDLEGPGGTTLLTPNPQHRHHNSRVYWTSIWHRWCP